MLFIQAYWIILGITYLIVCLSMQANIFIQGLIIKQGHFFLA
jgi:hypothetical protein